MAHEQWYPAFAGGDASASDARADNYEALLSDAWATHISPLSGNTQTTTKIPPSYDGKRLWFTYEDEIYKWCDITELDAEKLYSSIQLRSPQGGAQLQNLE